jgi:hypothetical protein
MSDRRATPGTGLATLAAVRPGSGCTVVQSWPSRADRAAAISEWKGGWHNARHRSASLHLWQASTNPGRFTRA